MKILLGFLLPIFLSTTTLAETGSVETVFKKHKVKLQKTDIFNGEKNYYVELPFDPSVGKNSNRLESEIVSVNACKSYTMISSVDKVRIHIVAQMKRNTCNLTETIEPLK